jgi:hypothetical protein
MGAVMMGAVMMGATANAMTGCGGGKARGRDQVHD